MFCTNCGSKIRDGSKFCTGCGAVLGPALTETPRFSYDTSAFEPAIQDQNPTDTTMTSGNSGGMDLSMVVKVVSIIFAVLYVIGALRLFPDLFSSVGYVVTQSKKVYCLVLALSNLLNILGRLLPAAALVVFALRRRTELSDNSAPLFIATAAAAVVRILLQIVGYILVIIGYKLSFPSYYSLPMDGLGKSIGINLLFAVICLGILFGLLFAEGNPPLIGGNGLEGGFKGTLDVLMVEISALLGQAQKKPESSAANQPQSPQEEPQGFAFTQQSDANPQVTPSFPPSEAQNIPPFQQNNAVPQGMQGTNNVYGYPNRIRTRVPENRGLLKYIVFSILTCGIYSLYFLYALSRDINEMCKEDGQETPGLLMLIALSIVTCGLYNIYYCPSILDRLSQNAGRYGVKVEESGLHYLLWCCPGVILCFVGPFVAMYILIKNTNKVAKAYNATFNL